MELKMADSKITGLTELAEAPSDDDVLAIVDVSETPDTTKKITVANLLSGVGGAAVNTLLLPAPESADWITPSTPTVSSVATPNITVGSQNGASTFLNTSYTYYRQATASPGYRVVYQIRWVVKKYDSSGTGPMAF